MKPSPRILQALRAQKLHPKLQVYANGDSVVNAVRAEQVSCLAIKSRKLLNAVPLQRETGACSCKLKDLPKAQANPGKLKAVPGDVLVSVFIRTRDPVAAQAGFAGQTSQQGDLVTAQVPLADLDRLINRDEVVYIEPGEALKDPAPVVTDSSAAVPGASLRNVGHANLHHQGKGVLVGIIDVQGFDFAHPDFLDAGGGTRFIRIWDQGGSMRPPPKDFTYGAEFAKPQFDAALKAAPQLGVPAYEIERQSQLSPGSHGTHVASIAAGNRGVAAQAVLAGVLISIPPEELKDPRRSFYDSTRLAHAVEYLVKLADSLKLPVAINISLGTNGHAHDGSSAVGRWIDAALARPGSAVCVAAGNAGQEKPTTANDFGFIVGRIHTSGKVPSRGLTHDLEWLVMGNGVKDLSENELELWYGAQDRFSVMVKPPGEPWIGPVAPRQFIKNRQLPDGSFLSVFNELYHPSNGANCISVYLTPLFSNRGVVGAKAGTWTIRLQGDEVRDGRFHGWIERDDPRRLGRVGESEAWSFPSFFSERSNVDDSSVSTLACGHNIISVANLDSASERINFTSSQGPTRDGRFKPDGAAPGTEIIAAKGFSSLDDSWIAMTGTSMASPFVCGVAALMLAAQPKLTAAQIQGILHRTSRPLPGADYQWRNDAGFGAISPEDCVLEASLLEQRKEVTV